MTIALGIVADDVTGGTDVAVASTRAGLRTTIHFGQPADGAQFSEATVVALKTRTIDPPAAARACADAAAWLREQGASRIYFKYCSTFDSTPRGNIGPVLDALSDALGAGNVVTTPSSPEHGRTQRQGRLFVNGVPLAESHMRSHPLTPMRDSDLTRLLAPQTRRTVGLLPLETVRRGPVALREAIGHATGHHLLADAVEDSDLDVIARAVLDDRLIAGGAGLAGAIARALAPAASHTTEAVAPTRPGGPAVVLSGSCSARTLEQIDAMLAAGRPHHRLDPVAHPDPDELANHAIAWFDSLNGEDAPVIYSSAPPDQLRSAQELLGTQRAAAILESATGRIAAALAERGVTRFVVAGGETSGAVVAALNTSGGIVGHEAAPGVPWIHADDCSLLLKSGNFGEPDLLLAASGGAS